MFIFAKLEMLFAAVYAMIWLQLQENQWRDALGLTEEFCGEYLKTFEMLYPQLPRQIIHRDPNPGNLILEGEKWGFIDFELSERNLRIYDPCYAATAIVSENFAGERERWPALFREILQTNIAMTRWLIEMPLI